MVFESEFCIAESESSVESVRKLTYTGKSLDDGKKF